MRHQEREEAAVAHVATYMYALGLQALPLERDHISEVYASDEDVRASVGNLPASVYSISPATGSQQVAMRDLIDYMEA